MDQNCIFCKIANKEIPGKVVYEDDVCVQYVELLDGTVCHKAGDHLLTQMRQQDSFQNGQYS